MKALWLVCIVGIIIVLVIAYNGRCGSRTIEGLRGGGGMRGGRGMGMRGGGWSHSRGRGGHHGGHFRRRHRWWGRRGSSYGYWPWWWGWWSNPVYYVDLPYEYTDIDEDPCDCFGKYKEAIDANVSKEDAAKILENCVRNTLEGGPCL